MGGGQGGPLVFLRHATPGDGTLAGLMVLAMMAHHERPLSELVGGFDPFPQAQLAVAVSRKPALSTLPTVREAIAGAEAALCGAGRARAFELTHADSSTR